MLKIRCRSACSRYGIGAVNKGDRQAQEMSRAREAGSQLSLTPARPTHKPQALQASLMEAGGDDEEPDESSSVASDSSSASEEDDAAALTDLLEEIVQSPTKTANGSNASPASSSTDEDDADSNMSDDDAQLGVQMSDEDEDEESEEESEGGKGDGAEQDEEETPAKRAKHEPIVAIFEPGARTSRTTAKSVSGRPPFSLVPCTAYRYLLTLCGVHCCAGGSLGRK